MDGIVHADHHFTSLHFTYILTTHATEYHILSSCYSTDHQTLQRQQSTTIYLPCLRLPSWHLAMVLSEKYDRPLLVSTFFPFLSIPSELITRIIWLSQLPVC